MLTINDTTASGGVSPTYSSIANRGLFKIGAKVYQKSADGGNAWSFDDCTTAVFSASTPVSPRDGTLTVA
jgi:hypothetical protein